MANNKDGFDRKALVLASALLVSVAMLAVFSGSINLFEGDEGIMGSDSPDEPEIEITNKKWTLVPERFKSEDSVDNYNLGQQRLRSMDERSLLRVTVKNNLNEIIKIDGERVSAGEKLNLSFENQVQREDTFIDYSVNGESKQLEFETPRFRSSGRIMYAGERHPVPVFCDVDGEEYEREYSTRTEIMLKNQVSVDTYVSMDGSFENSQLEAEITQPRSQRINSGETNNTAVNWNIVCKNKDSGLLKAKIPVSYSYANGNFNSEDLKVGFIFVNTFEAADRISEMSFGHDAIDINWEEYRDP